MQGVLFENVDEAFEVREVSWNYKVAHGFQFVDVSDSSVHFFALDEDLPAILKECSGSLEVHDDRISLKSYKRRSASNALRNPTIFMEAHSPT